MLYALWLLQQTAELFGAGTEVSLFVSCEFGHLFGPRWGEFPDFVDEIDDSRSDKAWLEEEEFWVKKWKLKNVLSNVSVLFWQIREAS